MILVGEDQRPGFLFERCDELVAGLGVASLVIVVKRDNAAGRHPWEGTAQ